MVADARVPDQDAAETEVDFRESDRIAKTWFVASALWFPFFAGFGFLLAIKFFFPEFLSGSAWDTFGRIRPAHINGVLFGFVSSGLIGAMFWIVPRLCARPIFRPKFSVTIPYLWNASVLAGIIMILLGDTQGREYAELPWAIDVAVMVTLLMMAYVVFGTVRRRKEKKLYVSLWYFMGTLVWFPIVYFIGNVMWKPPAGALNGTMDAIYNWYYGHNVLGLWFTTLGIPIWYYFIPRIIKRPLYSHLLSLIAFFTIAFFYAGVGSHHLLQAPVPEWLKTVAVIMSVLMLVPVLTFATNIMLTMRGSWHRLIGNAPLKFMMAGFVMYVLTSFQGSFQALRGSNAFLHFSQWTVGHAHLALLGGFGFLAIGMAYYLLPRITGIRMYSPRLTRLSFWLALIGFILFWLAMTVAGLAANANWWQHINPVQTLPVLRPYFIWRALAGGMVVVAAILFAYNFLATIMRGRFPHVEEDVDGLGYVSTEKPHSVFLRRSQEKLSIPVIIGGGMAVFGIMTFMVVGMPSMFTPLEPTLRAHELTTLELQGQELYKNLGCMYCHSQQTRPQDWAMGENSEAGDFYYSVPNFLGTERTGPNLAQIGGMRPSAWQTQHHEDPRSVSPASIMPSFAFLTDSEGEALTAYLQTLGGENLATMDFQPSVPWEYRGGTNPNDPLMSAVSVNYNFQTGQYSGDNTTAQQWTTLFEDGKAMFAQKCLSCHGGSGNGQGPYARNTVERPANLFERISGYPQPPDDFQFWRVSGGVPGTRMPQWGMSLSEEDIWKINTYVLSFTNGAMRTVPAVVPAEEAASYAATISPNPPISGSMEEYQKGEALYNLYCAQCHGTDGTGNGPASSSVPGGYINPAPFNLVDAGLAFTKYGEYLYFLREGYATTNMVGWTDVMSDREIYEVIFYIQGFIPAAEYNQNWAPLYTDVFAKGLKQ